MKKSKWYELGRNVGYNIASWIDLPEIGRSYWTEAEGKILVENVDGAADVFQSLALESESNARQDADWIYGVGDELRKARNRDKAWDDYDEGVLTGIRESWAERSESYYSENPTTPKKTLFRDAMKTRGNRRAPAAKRDVTFIRRVGVPAKRYVSRPSQITRTTPTKRLKARRKKVASAPAGYFPNPPKQAFPRYIVADLKGDNIAKFWTLKNAKEYAQALAQKTGKSYRVIGGQ